jgi:tripeptide aminopeptidase
MDETMYKELLELLTTDSASGKENKIAQLVISKLTKLGFAIIQDDAGKTFGGECGNVLGIREGTLPGSLLLCSHMDRVPNGLGIKPIEKEGILYSDGSTILAADDISGVCAILAGLRKVLATGIALPRLEVLFTVGEETGLNGAKAMDMSKLKSRIGYIFDSPGPVGRFVHAAPGRYGLRVDITGRAAHAGNEPEKGIDAAKIMCDMISTLRQGRLDEISTANFPILRTGTTAANVVCDNAWFEGETRSRDLKRLTEYIKYFEEHCTKVAAEHGAGIKITKSEDMKPFTIPEEAQVLQIAKVACTALALNCKIDVGGGGMDANIFNGKGLSTVGVATGYTKNHTKQEQLVLADFFKAGELAAELIKIYAASCANK